MAKRSSKTGSTTKKTPAKGKKKKSGPVTLDDTVRILILHGKENYLLTEYLSRLRANISEKHGEVEVLHFDGPTASLADILDEARSFGLIAQYKIIVVDDADALVKAGENRRILERYAESPVDEATLVLRSTTWNKGKLDKLVAEVGAVIKCESPNEPQAIGFCSARVEKRYECSIAPDAAELLVRRIGPILSKLDGELGRLALMASPPNGNGEGRPTIDAELVRREVPLSREEQAWEVQAAILSGHSSMAIEKVRELLEVSRQPATLVNYFVLDLIRKLHRAAWMKRRGVPDGEIASAMRLWGPGRNPFLQLASTMDPRDLTNLMKEAIQGDVRAKTGLGKAERGIEMTVTRFLQATASARR